MRFAPASPQLVAPTIAVAVSEGHDVFRRRLLVHLEAEGDIAVVAESSVPGELSSILSTVTPHVMAVDLSTPHDDVPAPVRANRSLDGVARLVQAMPTVKVLALAGPNDDAAAALLAGADGSITKTAALRHGRDAIRTLSQGELLVDRRAARSLAALIDREPDAHGLNRHHVEVLHQVSSGRSLLELARFFRTEIPELQAMLEEIVRTLRAAGVSGHR